MATFAIGIEYEGSVFYGWQRQPNRLTVQGVLETALTQVADTPTVISGAGRTDAGVHAMGQVASFVSDANRTEEQWLKGLNSLTPKQVNVAWVREVEDSFHARFKATARRYLYLFMEREQDTQASHLVWTVGSLDIDAMHQQAQCLVGEHDFTSFRGAGCQANTATRRINHCIVRRCGSVVVLDIEANAFLLHMVRNIASCLSRVDRNDSEDYVEMLLKGKDRRKIGMTAPANGLYFYQVEYPKYSFPSSRKPSILAAVADTFS